MRLSPTTRDVLAPTVTRPTYDRTDQKTGIVHFGIGAFHRAHQAVYTDDAMQAGDRDWMITGVSLRTADVRDQLKPQQGLYTVSTRSSGSTETRLIGAIETVLVAPQSPDAVVDILAAPDTHIVSFTITEKGYWRTPDGALDPSATDVAHDLLGVGAPRTIYGFLLRSFVRRRDLKLPGLTLLSCDNLAENGAILATLLGDFLDRVDPATALWFRTNCTCPSTMVDRIAPATTAVDRDRIAVEIGLRDEAAVVTEPFRQWVIEDRFAGPRPRWDLAEAQFVDDVRPYEKAKLRMLNGAHSALAYLGLRAGHDFVHQAIADPEILPLVERIIRHEAPATLDPGSRIDVIAYADALLARFGNTALPHRLGQIAMDGSQKIPQRWLQPLAINQAANRASPATLWALAAWVLHVRGDAGPVEDPMAEPLAALWATKGIDEIVGALFGTDGLFNTVWIASAADCATLDSHILSMERPDVNPSNDHGLTRR